MVPHCGWSASLRASASIWNDFSGDISTTIHSPKFICLGRGRPIVPMRCPKCSGCDVRAVATNTRETDVTTRKRKCLNCGHCFFTVELPISPAAVGWGKVGRDNQSKPVLRVPIGIVIRGRDE